MGPQKNKNGTISVGHYCGERAVGQKDGNGPKITVGSCFVLWPPMEITYVVTEKLQTCRTVNTFLGT